jgi:uncharacterized membrane protein
MRAKAIRKLKNTDMQWVIGFVLRAGVLTSLCIVIFGGVIYIIHEGSRIEHYDIFKGGKNSIGSANSYLHNVFILNGRTIIQTGLILLIATPIIRVAFSAIVFLKEKDYLYTGITLLVLTIIFTSMLTGHVG